MPKDDSRFIGNRALERGSGGAIAAKNSELIIQNVTCIGNIANDGGAVSTVHPSLQITGMVTLENNTAQFGGVLHIAGLVEIVIANILEDLSLASRYRIAIRIYASKIFWQILIWRLLKQTTKPQNIIPRQISGYIVQCIIICQTSQTIY